MHRELIYLAAVAGFFAGCAVQVLLIRIGMWSVLTELRRLRADLNAAAELRKDR